jgi:hypothetical protein
LRHRNPPYPRIGPGIAADVRYPTVVRRSRFGSARSRLHWLDLGRTTIDEKFDTVDKARVARGEEESYSCDFFREAIVLLARYGLSGSALALVRPVFEILYRAAWICACAKPKEVDRIKAGKFTFPKLVDMVAAIDAKHGFDFFKGFKPSSWNEQNDFTHTGNLQIGSRLTRDDLQAAYPDEMIVVLVTTATIAAMMVAVLLLKTHNRTSDGERLEKVMTQFFTP